MRLFLPWRQLADASRAPEMVHVSAALWPCRAHSNLQKFLKMMAGSPSSPTPTPDPKRCLPSPCRFTQYEHFLWLFTLWLSEGAHQRWVNHPHGGSFAGNRTRGGLSMSLSHKAKDMDGSQILLLILSPAFCQSSSLGPLGCASENVPQWAQIFKRHLGGCICLLIMKTE